jgi:hypothetical protein
VAIRRRFVCEPRQVRFLSSELSHSTPSPWNFWIVAQAYVYLTGLEPDKTICRSTVEAPFQSRHRAYRYAFRVSVEMPIFPEIKFTLMSKPSKRDWPAGATSLLGVTKEDNP